MEISQDTIYEYLHHEDIAEDVFAYYLVYKKYQDDYGIDDILNGNVSSTIYARLFNADFDERVSVVNLVMDGLLRQVNIYSFEKHCTDLWFGFLKNYRSHMDVSYVDHVKEFIALYHDKLASVAEGQMGADELNVDIEDVLAALDEEESSRIELQDGYTLILVDIPSIETRHDKESYTTIPLGIILTDDEIVTVCTEDTPVLQVFLNNRVKEFSTKKKMRFVYQILYRISVLYQNDLRIIDKMRTEIEERVGEDTEEDDLIALHELESTLVYFATSLRANGVVLERLTRYKRLEQYPEDKELLGDVIVENKQAIEMTGIYRDIINGTRELMSTVIDNRLNNVMKSLTIITLIMAIPTVISGIYGMNVSSKWVPLATTAHGFMIIIGVMVVICVLILILLKKKRIL